MKLCYLKPTIVLEPLISQWYAWLHLVSPMTAGLHFKQRYLKILNSFIEYPELHQEACKNPELMSGFFANLSSDDSESAKELLNNMQVLLLPLTQLADDILKLHTQLVLLAKGQSLEQLYALIPSSLQGAVELLYETQNHLCIRFIEPILYNRFYNDSLQSVVLSHTMNIDNRPFILSTPRLPRKGNVHLKIPFNSNVIDQLMLSREKGIDLKNFYESSELGLTTQEQQFLEDMFTTEKPDLPKDCHYLGDNLRVRYLGHACILLQTQNTSILVDPFLSNYPACKDRYGYFDLPEIIDCVLITHAHQDHMVLETLLQIRHKVRRFIVPRNNGGFLQDPSIKQMLKQVGFDNIDTLDEFEKVQIKDITITGIPFFGEHGDLNIQSKLAYYVTVMEKSILFAVDSNNIDSSLYQSIRDLVGQIDILFIGMECVGAPYSWVYGPLSLHPVKKEHDQSRRLSGSNAEKAWDMVKILGATTAYVYAMGIEPWLSHILNTGMNMDSEPIMESNKFIQKCLEQNINSKRLYFKDEIII